MTRSALPSFIIAAVLGVFLFFHVAGRFHGAAVALCLHTSGTEIDANRDIHGLLLRAEYLRAVY